MDSIYQQEQQEPQQQYYAPAPDVMTKLGESVLQLTNPRDLIQQIKLNLENYEYNIEGELVKNTKATLLLNEEGKRRILGVVHSIVTQNSVMSNIESRQDVENMIQHLSGELIKLLFVSRKKFGIKTREDASQILVYVLYPCYFTMMRCYKQGEKNFLKGSVQEIIQGHKEQKKKGFFGSILGG